MQHQVQVQLGKQIRVMENRLDKVTIVAETGQKNSVWKCNIGRLKEERMVMDHEGVRSLIIRWKNLERYTAVIENV